MDKMKIRTRRQLLKWAKAELGIEPVDAVKIIKNNELGGRFDSGRMPDYVAVLVTHSEKLRRSLSRISDEITVTPVEICPICGAPTERRQDRDGLYHSPYGWACTEVVGHWAEWSWHDVKDWMTRGRQEKERDSKGRQGETS